MLLPELMNIVMGYKHEFEQFPRRLARVKQRGYDLYQQSCAIHGLFTSHFGEDRFPEYMRDGMRRAASFSKNIALVMFELLAKEAVLTDDVLCSLRNEEQFVEDAKLCPEPWVSRICDIALLEGLIHFSPELTNLADVPTIEFKNSD